MFSYRDFGGIKNNNNKEIKSNMIFRSTHLYKVNFFNRIKINYLKLSKIIDLRTDSEIKEKPDKKFKNIKYCHIPIFNENIIGITHEKENTSIELLEYSPSMIDLYKIMVTNDFSVLQLKKIINEIVKSDNFGILFHCTIGKDRTGIISMLILTILDVDMDTIMTNYLHNSINNIIKSNVFYFLVRTKTKNKELALKAKSIFLTDEKYLLSAINAINSKYGNLDNFIRDTLEISDSDKENFKSKILK